MCFCEIDGRVLGGMQFGDSCAGATGQSLAFCYLGSMLVYFEGKRSVLKGNQKEPEWLGVPSSLTHTHFGLTTTHVLSTRLLSAPLLKV